MAAAGRHFAGTNTQFMIKYLRSRRPAGTVERVLQRAGEHRSPEALLDPLTWSTYSEFRSLLTACASELGDDVLPAIGLDAFADVSTPEATAMLQAFGSPSSLYADIGPAAASLSPVRCWHPHTNSPAYCSCMDGAAVRARTWPAQRKPPVWAAFASLLTCADTSRNQKPFIPSRAPTISPTSSPHTTGSRSGPAWTSTRLRSSA